MVQFDNDTCLSEFDFVAFDVETTGLSPVANRLVELSGVKFRRGSETFETFSTLIDPEVPIPSVVTGIHGITDDMVQGAPTAKDAVNKFVEWSGCDSVMMAHNAPFDVEFLRVNLARAGAACPANFVVDTLTISREFLRETKNHQLKTVVEHFSLPQGDYHRALSDSFHVKNVFLRLLQDYQLNKWNDLTINGFVSKFDYDHHAESTMNSLPEQTMLIVEAIRGVIERSASMVMEYQGSFKSTPNVQPTALIHSRGNLYLSAFCRRAQAERTFRVDKISKIKSVSG
ncbi:MAG: exonuclease domain-containing protein [Candidatus Melainabacteria bacterium]|nr:exonuclease domain-containing protein [Candidatus Melainabacteria bacterium]